MIGEKLTDLLRPTTWASSAAPYPTNTASSPNTSASINPKSAPLLENPSIISSGASSKRRDYDKSCGLENFTSKKKKTTSYITAILDKLHHTSHQSWIELDVFFLERRDFLPLFDILIPSHSSCSILKLRYINCLTRTQTS